MDISTEPNVVGQVPAIVIRIVIDDDVVTVPGPVATEAKIDRSDAEVESAEPEAAWTPAGKMPPVTVPNSAWKVAVLPRMVKMEAGVIAPIVVADPLSVSVNVGSFGMTFLVAKILFGRILVRRGSM